jgi:hypothetical protein
MKFGILYNTDYYPAAHQSPSNYYAQLLEQTELAEKLWLRRGVVRRTPLLRLLLRFALGDRDGRCGTHTADSPRHRSLADPATVEGSVTELVQISCEPDVRDRRSGGPCRRLAVALSSKAIGGLSDGAVSQDPNIRAPAFIFRSQPTKASAAARRAFMAAI